MRTRGSDGAFHDLDYASLLERVLDLAAALRARGLGKGDRFAIWLESSADWIFADLAANLLGATTATLFHSLPAQQAALILRDSGAKLLLSTGKRIDALAGERTAPNSIPELAQTISVDGGGDLLLSDLMKIGAGLRRADPALDKDLRAPAVGPDELSALIYTSGTTGEPKGAMLSHGNIVSNIDIILETFYLRPTHPSMWDGETILLHLPLAHVMGRNVSTFVTLIAGGCVAIADPEREKLPQNILEIRPHAFVTVPYLLDKIMVKVEETVAARGAFATKLFHRALELGLKKYRRQLSAFERIEHAILDRLLLKKVRAKLGGRVHRIIIGGANPNPASVDFFCALGIVVSEGYGSTEMTTVSFTMPGETHSGTTVAPGVELKFAPDNELLVKGPNLMKGYWNKPEATREAIDSEGYWHSGDIGALDEFGLLHIVDRKKEIFVCSTGKNVAPQAVENALKRSSLFANACAFGDNEKYISVLLVLDPQSLQTRMSTQSVDQNTLIETELKTCCKDLAGFEQPKRWAVVEEPFTMENGQLTPTLKLKRRAIRERYFAVIESLYDRTAQKSA